MISATGSHVRRFTSKYSKEARNDKDNGFGFGILARYVLARSTNYVEGQLHRALMRSITELLGRRRLGGEGRPFKAKIRRNDRLTLVVVLYPPAHMAHKFPPTTANWITSHGRKHGQRCNRKIMLPTLRTNSSRFAPIKGREPRDAREKKGGKVYRTATETIAKLNSFYANEMIS